MAMEMTKGWLLERCKAQGLYRTPHLNDSLYLQCQAFSKIQNLDEYTGVKQLHLEENCIESLDGVQPLKKLQSLYLTRNLVKGIDHLKGLEDLDTLDLSHNGLSKLENLSACKKLRVLVVSYNLLDSVASIAHLGLCPSIMILDLSHNKFKDGDGVLGVAKSLANLAVLYLSGNPFVAAFPHYRKKLIGSLAKLNHLDDRPVFWDERRYAEAWMRGGQGEESRERDLVHKMRATEESLQFEAMRQLRSQFMEERQFVGPCPMLQFSPEELGEDVESLSCPPPDETEPLLTSKIELYDEKAGSLGKTSPANYSTSAIQVEGSWIEGGSKNQEQGECSTSYSMVEAHCSMEHDLMLSQDKNQQWQADNSKEHVLMIAQDTDLRCEEDCFMETDTMLAHDQNQHIESPYDSMLAQDQNHSQGEEGGQSSSKSTNGNHMGFSLKSPSKEEHNSAEHEPMVLSKSKGWPMACPSGLDLGTICLPACEPASQLLGEEPLESTIEDDSNLSDLNSSLNENQSCTDINKQGSPSLPSQPPEQGSDSYEWKRFYDNPSFCGGPNFDDNFLFSLQGMNNIEPNCTEESNQRPCGQQIDDNFLLSMHRMNHIEPTYIKNTMSTNFSDTKEHECDLASVC